MPNEYWGWVGESPDRSHFTEPGHQRLARFLLRRSRRALGLEGAGAALRFNSPVYLAFLPMVVLAVWLTPARARRWVLLVASYVFYASWHWPYLGLLVGSAALNHWGAKWIVAGPPNRKWRGGWVLAANVLLLAIFKYLSWLCENVNAVARGWGSTTW